MDALSGWADDEDVDIREIDKMHSCEIQLITFYLALIVDYRIRCVDHLASSTEPVRCSLRSTSLSAQVKHYVAILLDAMDLPLTTAFRSNSCR